MSPPDIGKKNYDTSNFTVVIANNRPLILDDAVEEAILCALSEKELTQAEISKMASIPTSTTYNHLQRMCELGLVTVDRDNRTLYKNNSKILLSTDYSRLAPNVGNRLIDHMKDGGNLFMYAFIWTMVQFESLGIDPSYVSSEFGTVVGNMFNKDDHSKTIESLVEEMSEFLVEKGFADSFEVLTFLPLTFHSEYDLPFDEYPIEQTQHIIVNVVKCILDKFTGEKNYHYNVKIGFTDTGRAFMEFSMSSLYRPDSDPWKILSNKHM